MNRKFVIGTCVCLLVAGYILVPWGTRTEAADEDAPEKTDESMPDLSAKMAYLNKTHPELLATAERALDKWAEREPPSLTRGHVPTVGGSGPNEDREWASFPRSSFDLAKRLVGSPGRIKASDFYRHKLLNPGDVYIGKGQRQLLERLMGGYDARMAGIRKVQNDIVAKEFAALRRAGMARRVTESELAQTLPPRERIIYEQLRKKDRKLGRKGRIYPTIMFPGNQPYTGAREADGSFTTARFSEMPVTHRLLQFRVYETTQFVLEFLSWFERNAGTTKATISKTTDEVARRVSEKLGLK